MNEALLIVGSVAAIVFVAVLLVEGVLRPGYDPIYHTGSELSLGDRGWIQIANFLLMGLGTWAFALGVHRTLDAPVGAALLALFGLGMIVAGVFRPDPVRGYPPGASSAASGRVTWVHTVHGVIGGPVAFFAIFGACLVLAARLDGPWQGYTLATAVLGLALTLGTALAYSKDAALTGLVQRSLILVYWSWIVAIGLHLA